MSDAQIIHSKILGEDIVVMADGEHRPEWDGLVIYNAEECRNLVQSKMSEDGIRSVHAIKKAFPESRIVKDGWSCYRMRSKDELAALWPRWNQRQKLAYMKVREEALGIGLTPHVAANTAAERAEALA